MMRFKKWFNILIILIMVFSFSINVVAEVLPEYKQVNYIGGENSSDDGVKVSKTIKETDIENYFDITLKVSTTSSVDEILKDQDLAVVLVLDISNTMNYNSVSNIFLSANDPNSRINLAKNSVKKFIDMFYEYSRGVTATRQIGLVTFNRDSYDVFDGLMNVKNKNIDELKNKVSSITAPSLVDVKWTNMEAGLTRANDLLSRTNVKNKYVVFLTDGLPTTYTMSGYTGYNPYGVVSKNNNEYNVGNFYNYEKDVAIDGGTNYSEWGARKAESVAYNMKKSGIEIYSIGVGITKQHTLEHLQNNGFKQTVDTDKRENNYEYTKNATYKKARYYSVLPNASYDEVYDNTNYYKTWLSEYIASDKLDSGSRNYYYDSDDSDSFDEVYENIFSKIVNSSNTLTEVTWVVEDPMSMDEEVGNIEFVGLYDDINKLHNSLDYTKINQSNTASFNKNRITWDLRKSKYSTIDDGDKLYYVYEVKYRVRLENEKANFEISKPYDTNGRTTLTYAIRTNDVLSENKYLDFPIPRVEGYLGNLTFTKLSNYYKTPLQGATFKLIHDTLNCKCQHERVHPTIDEIYATSDENGKVSFENIPSGHTYKLIETVYPTNYETTNIYHTVVVSYGKVTMDGKTDNLTVENTIKTSDLKLKKKVYGNVEESGNFKFEIELKNGSNPITDEFEYTIGSKKGTISFDKNGKALVWLKNNEEIIIYNIPYDVSYKISEITTDGYQVKYCINDNDSCINSKNIQIGKEANGNISEENRVEFVNITSYVLPETGSSTGLTLMIIGSFLLVVPIVYIIILLFYKRKEEKV